MKAWPCGCCQFGPGGSGFIVCPDHQVVVGGMTVMIPGGLSQDELDALTLMHKGSAVLTQIAEKA